VTLLAPAATLVAREEFHPALIDLLLQAAARVHRTGGVFETRGEFPSPDYLDFRLSEDAERYFKYGPPFLQRVLPFWLATLVDRLKVMLLPVLILLIPLFKVIPPAFKWKSRRKIIRGYKNLLALDAGLEEESIQSELARAAEEVDRIEGEVTKLSMPLGFSDQLYTLRQHINLVRDKINRLRKP
jgi:hypothetical protein